jgi:UDP-N-acetylglucosamine 1-carboxyvinyltransferase
LDKIVIRGRRSLRGTVRASGAKNAALPILAATLLCEGPCRLSNVPALVDVATVLKLLEHLGAKIERRDDNVALEWTRFSGDDAPYDLVRKMRASVLVLGPLVARLGRARVSLPGGCAIGARPINLHLAGLEKLGVRVQIEHGYVLAEATRLIGGRIYLDFPTVTGTENLVMAATLAQGTTTIENAAKEPEIVDLCAFLIACGARIRGHGTDRITIEGVPRLTGADYRVMPDRIETGTFLAAGAITGGEVTIEDCAPPHLEAVILKLREIGLDLEVGPNRIWSRAKAPLRAADVKTLPYPGFPTDMQAQIMAVLCLAEGLSVVTETVFESRFSHLPELRRMGADIRIQGNNAIIQGVPRLSGAPIMASDLRASAGLIVAGLAAEGETVVNRVYHLDRGYERIEQKLRALGAAIERVPGGA